MLHKHVNPRILRIEEGKTDFANKDKMRNISPEIKNNGHIFSEK